MNLRVLILYICALAITTASALEPTDTVRTRDCQELVPASFLPNATSLNAGGKLDSIAALINRTLSDGRLEMKYLRIGGSASPDGKESLNRRLAQERADAVANYLRQHTRLKSGDIRVVNFGEDWDELRSMLEESDYSFKDDVLALIDSEPDDDRREATLRKMNGGTTWRTLISEVFPALRCTRVEICRDTLDITARMEQATAFVEDTLDIPETEINMELRPETVDLPEVSEEEEIVKDRFWAVKTNALHLALLTANAGVEIQVADRWSIDVPFWYSPYNLSSRTKWRILATQPEARLWMRKAGEGHFVGVHAHIIGFNVALKSTDRYQDPNHAALGLGIGYGYAKTFGKDNRWAVDFNIGAGFVNYKFDAYDNVPNGHFLRSGSGTYWGITRLGISISYRWHRTKRNKEKGGDE